MRGSNKNKIKILFGVAMIMAVAGFLVGVFFDKDGQKIADEPSKENAFKPDQTKTGGAIDLVRPPFLNE